MDLRSRSPLPAHTRLTLTTIRLTPYPLRSQLRRKNIPTTRTPLLRIIKRYTIRQIVAHQQNPAAHTINRCAECARNSPASGRSEPRRSPPALRMGPLGSIPPGSDGGPGTASRMPPGGPREAAGALSWARSTCAALRTGRISDPRSVLQDCQRSLVGS